MNDTCTTFDRHGGPGVDKNKTCECAGAVSWDTALKFYPQSSAMTSPDRLEKNYSKNDRLYKRTN